MAADNRQQLISNMRSGNLRTSLLASGQRQRQLYLSNLDRLKYETVHVLNGKLFMPTVVGILNEDI